MMKDQFANYVVQKIFEKSNDRQREILLNRTRVHLNALRKYTYGKHIVARFEQLCGEGVSLLYRHYLLYVASLTKYHCAGILLLCFSIIYAFYYLLFSNEVGIQSYCDFRMQGKR